MSNKRTQIEELFLLAREAKHYSSSEHTLLRSVEVAPAVEIGARRIKANYRSTSSCESDSIQNKLHLSYGL